MRLRAEHRWTATFVAAAALFAVAATLSLGGAGGISPGERHLYDSVTATFPKTTAIFRVISDLGTGTIIVPAAILLVAFLPREFIRRWWIWLAILLTASALEHAGKAFIARPRPEGIRFGFPSGHTAAAAVFYLMAAYGLGRVFTRRWPKVVVYGLAAALVALVGLSRVVLHAHWPLDVLGGAALGVAVLAAGVWWHERHPAGPGRLPVRIPPAAQAWVYRWQAALPLPILAVLLFLKPPMVAEDSVLDGLFDLSGVACMAAGLLLRLWTVAYAGRQAVFPRALPTQLITAGPYARMRHPLPIGNCLIGIGVMLLTESAPGIILIPGVLLLVYRVALPFEETRLSEQFGGSYVEYCGRVPRIPRAPRPSPAMADAGVRLPVWRCLVAEAPVVAATAAFALLAEAHEVIPHLLR